MPTTKITTALAHPLSLFAAATVLLIAILLLTTTQATAQVRNTTTCPDGKPPRAWWFDEDGDGYHSKGYPSELQCEAPGPNWRDNTKGLDCDDKAPLVWEDITYYRDQDGDGFGYINWPEGFCSATPPAGYAANDDDCNDSDNTVYPGAPEVEDGKDNDCDGQIDEGILRWWYKDVDEDGFGGQDRIKAAQQPPGRVANNMDCNDYKKYYQDLDKDSYGNSNLAPCLGAFRNGDCDDNNNKIHSLQTYYRDSDKDGYGDKNNKTAYCSYDLPDGYVKNSTDCDDNDKLVYWNKRYYYDNDHDGFGDASRSVLVCLSSPPANYVANSKDPNDNDPTIPVKKTTVPPSSTPMAGTIEPVALNVTVMPNPFGNVTRIQYTLPVESQVRIQVFDLLGREVDLVSSGRRSAGTHYTDYNTGNLASGVYYCRLTAKANGNEVVQTQKLVKKN